MNEIKIVTPEITYTSCVIGYDFAQLDSHIEQIKEQLATIELTESNLPLIKVYMTNLKKASDAVNGKKQEIKRKAAPDLPLFEKECMVRVNALIGLRETMKEFVEKAKENELVKKKETIETYFKEHHGILDVPFKVIWDDEYYKMVTKKWQIDLDVKVNNIEKEYARIDDLLIDDTPLLKTLFLQHWDYNVARNIYDDMKVAEKRKKELKTEQASPSIVLPTCDEIPVSVPVSQSKIVKMWTVSGEEYALFKGMQYLQSLGIIVEEV